MVNYKLRNKIRDDVSKSHFKPKTEVNSLPKLQERRSPEEFQAYLKSLFDNHDPIFKYHWYFTSRKKGRINIVELTLDVWMSAHLGTPIIITNGGFSSSKIFNCILNINKLDTLWSNKHYPVQKKTVTTK